MEPLESSKPFVTTNPLFVVSGGDGTSGEKLVNTVLAQFKDVNVPVIIEPGGVRASPHSGSPNDML